MNLKLSPEAILFNLNNLLMKNAILEMENNQLKERILELETPAEPPKEQE